MSPSHSMATRPAVTIPQCSTSHHSVTYPLVGPIRVRVSMRCDIRWPSASTWPGSIGAVEVAGTVRVLLLFGRHRLVALREQGGLDRVGVLLDGLEARDDRGAAHLEMMFRHARLHVECVADRECDRPAGLDAA